MRNVRCGGAAPADIEFTPVPNMKEQIAGATPLSQLFVYMNNLLAVLVLIEQPRLHRVCNDKTIRFAMLMHNYCTLVLFSLRPSCI